MTQTPAQEAFERFRRTLALPLVKVRVDGNMMSYKLHNMRAVDNFSRLAGSVIEIEGLPLKVLQDRNQHLSAMGDFYVTIQYSEQ